jgi:hypothetical protein
MQVLPPHTQRAQACRCQVHVCASRYDYRSHGSTIQGAVDSRTLPRWPQGDGGKGCSRRDRTVQEIHGALRHDTTSRGGRRPASVSEWTRKGEEGSFNRPSARAGCVDVCCRGEFLHHGSRLPLVTCHNIVESRNPRHHRFLLVLHITIDDRVESAT